EAIDANKPVYLEKPIASEMSDAEALYEHAVRRNAHVTVGFNYRFHPLIARRRQQIQSAEVQKARSVFSIAPRPLPCWKQQRTSGGGVVLDLASHHFDLLRFLTGAEVLTVSARVWSERSEGDCAEVHLNFTYGIEAN